MSKRIPFTKMTKLELLTGFEDEPPIVMDIAPTMPTITHGGFKFHRMCDGHTIYPDGSLGAMYLREDYGQRKLAELKANK